MAAKHRKRWILLALVAAVIGAAAWWGPDQLARTIRERSVAIVEQACGPRSHITIRQVQISLLAGNVSWRDVDIEQQVDSADTTWTYDRAVLISGHVDSVQVQGLSIWRLLLWKTLALRTVRISGPQLDLITGNQRPAGPVDEEGPRPAAPNALVTQVRLDTLAVDSGRITVRNVRPDRPRVAGRRFGMQATGLRLVLPHRHVPFSLTFSTARTQVDDADIGLPPLYDAHIDRLTVAHPDSLLHIRGIRLTPRKGPQDYGSAVRYETDLFGLAMDSLVLRGFDIGAALNTNTLRTGELLLAGTHLDVHRDKTLPDEPFRHKNMPARLLRSLPIRTCIDSLVVRDLAVTYREKDVLSPDYGEVVFDRIQAVARGICTTSPESRPVVRMEVNARVYGQAPIHLDFRTAVFDSSDHFSVHARIGALPFQVFNRMTDDLVLVRATSGTVGGIDYTLEADEDRAHGRVDMEYADLSLSVTKRDGSRSENKLMSFLANRLTHGSNIRPRSPTDGNSFRHGDLTIERKKDRQIFNYLWRGLREGMVVTVLPKVVSDVKDATQGVSKGGKAKARRKK